MSCAKKLNLKRLKEQYAELCMGLNIEGDIQFRSWQIYLETSKHLLAEGDPMHWLCCSLYIAWQTYQAPFQSDRVYFLGRSNFVSLPFKYKVHPAITTKTQAPMLGESNDFAGIGNGMNLNSLLRTCGLSITNFINKLKYWNCSSLEKTVQIEILKLERKFCLNVLVFNHYKDVFMQIFQLIPDGTPSQQVDQFDDKSNNKKYNCQNLFDMCWLLYLCAKYEMPTNLLDFVHLHDLSTCCIELLYRNVLDSKRFDLINMKFIDGVPQDWLNGNFDVSIPQDYCVIEALCRITSANPEDVKKMKHGVFQEVMVKLLKTYMIYGFRKSFLGLTADLTFWLNFRTLNKKYDKFIMKVCDIDERVIPNKSLIPRITNRTTKGTTTKENINQQEEFLKQTKLQFLNAFDRTLYHVKRLQSVTDRKESLRVALMKTTPLGITTMLNVMREQFCAASVIEIKETIQRFNLAQSLYYYFLTKILLGEKTHKPNLCLTTLFEQPIFNCSLMACCLELVLKAYNTTTHKFPWILKCCNIQALDFYKILEIVVRHHEGVLTPLLIKHLRSIEEVCLETLVWRRTSILWPLVKTINTSLPSYNEVKENVASKQNLLKLGNIQRTINEKTGVMPSRKSFYLFMRKLYNLAWDRLDDLCSCLRLKNDNDMLPIWLIFQYSITHKPIFMLERHLDQLIMCSIYIHVRKNCLRNIQFSDILKYYHYQRHAQSNNYRKVLLKPDVYSNIIDFYNRNYLPAMEDFVLYEMPHFGYHTRVETPEDFKVDAHTCRVSPHHHIYTSPLIKNKIKNMNYKFRDRHLQDLDALANGYRCRKRPNILKRIKGTISIKQKTKVL